MSLLLDALKKAADEKKKTAVDSESTAASDSKSERDDDDLDLTLDDDLDWQNDREKKGGEELEQLTGAISAKPGVESRENSNQEGGSQQVVSADRAGGSSGYNVSDEALNLLIHKTNRNYKKRKIILVVLVSIASLSILAAGGLYFTQNMQAEVGFLETRHVNALRMVREKTSKEKLPEKSEIIKNLVSDKKLEQKVAFAKAEIERKQKQEKENAEKEKKRQVEKSRLALADTHKKAEENVTIAKGRKSGRSGELIIQKTRTADPVSVLLDKAWLEYDRKEFSHASELYRKVLETEPDNRDALLGLGAIASLNNSLEKAKNYYLRILQKDPGDPDAIAALTTMSQQLEQGNSEAYLKKLLDKNRRSPVLNFTLGNVYASEKRWKLAQEAYFNAWVNDKENPTYNFNLAVSLDQLGKARQARKFYEASLRLSKNKSIEFSEQTVINRIEQLNKAGNQ